jgi:hypothetical protein
MIYCPQLAQGRGLTSRGWFAADPSGGPFRAAAATAFLRSRRHSAPVTTKRGNFARKVRGPSSRSFNESTASLGKGLTVVTNLNGKTAALLFCVLLPFFAAWETESAVDEQTVSRDSQAGTVALLVTPASNTSLSSSYTAMRPELSSP